MEKGCEEGTAWPNAIKTVYLLIISLMYNALKYFFEIRFEMLSFIIKLASEYIKLKDS